MKLYKCDRCGAVGTPDDFIRLDMCIRGCSDDAFSKDLCTSCMVDLVRWLNGDPEGISSAHALGVIRKLEDEVRTVENIPDYGRRDRTEFKFGYRNGCQKAIDLLKDGFSETAIGSAEQAPAPPGTFEWVLARIRMGASPEAFRRSTWPKGVHLGVEDGKKLMVYAGNRVLDHVNGYEILVTEWEEIPPKEGSE